MPRKKTLKPPAAEQVSANCWRCKVQVDRRQIVVYGETEYDAQVKALAAKEGLVEGKDARRKKGPTVREACLEYINLKEPVSSPATVRGYLSTVKNRLQTIMDIRCADLTKKLLQSAVNAEILAGRTVKSIKNDIGLLRPALREYQPIDSWGISYPVSIQEEHKILTKSEIPLLLDAIRGDDAEAQILMALELTMRRSEILGLMWDCVDLNAGTLTVRRSMVQGRDCRKILKDVPKTAKSFRTLRMTDRIVELLSMTPEEDRTGLVFNHDYNYATQHLNRICKKYGITKAGLHGMRHTNATLMSSLGVPEKVVMARGGWSTPHVMKRVYTHAFEEDMESAAEAINEYFAEKSFQ